MRGGKRKGGAMYAVASGLKGFRSSNLRIRVERDLGDVVIARTADLLNAGLRWRWIVPKCGRK